MTLINVTSTVRTVLDRIKFYVTCIFSDFVTKVGLGKIFLFLHCIESPWGDLIWKLKIEFIYLDITSGVM